MADALVAAVTVVYAAQPDGAGGSPEDVAATLLEQEAVSTVRVGAHGGASGFRVDVPARPHDEAVEYASAIAHDVAGACGLLADVLSVGLVRDRDRVEVHRTGPVGDELIWGTP